MTSAASLRWIRAGRTPSSTPPRRTWRKWSKSLTDGRGADSVIEMAGKDDIFQLAWKIARPNGIIALIAMYEEDQTLPLPSMYGKNLTWKTGGVDACKDQMLVDLIACGKLNPRPLFTHKMPLNDIMRGYEIFREASGRVHQGRDHALRGPLRKPSAVPVEYGGSSK